ncbi:YwdI family protein [Staphylococcus lugdunensis]|uniref:DUF5327 family protein n=1 Tax=Staphylococcus lugdunensis TaxID=28035 RepID=UPI001F4CBB81|nr:DUF5327 family protein [Staphylococcus lugdunensis]MCH8647032.1 YwdI family protein [Staphylococcus lugdunensis]
MDREKIIQLIEQELVQADEASNEQQFEKHIYAIHTLTSLYTTTTSGHRASQETSQDDIMGPTFSTTVKSNTRSAVQQTGHKQTAKVTAAEIEAMGGKVPNFMKSSHNTNVASSNTMVTDDEIGNGDSIFDF